MYSDQFLHIVDESIDPQGKELIFKFFISFSRFECALKNTLIFTLVNNNNVRPNWDRFINSISDDFQPNRTPALFDAVDYLITNPPKRQQIANRQLSWQNLTLPPQTSMCMRLGIYIRTVRNNLFHGGKFVGSYEPDISRNYTLINNCLIILDEWLSLNEDVKKHFLTRIVA